MAGAAFRFDETVDGGKATATMKVNGNIEQMFYIKKLEATAAKNKEEGRTLGINSVQHKGNGWTGTGSISMYYATSIFRKMMLDYMKTNRDVFFDITIENNDTASGVGKQVTVLYNCNIDEVMMAALDVDTPALEEEVPFTFTGVDILDEFSKPALI